MFDIRKLFIHTASFPVYNWEQRGYEGRMREVHAGPKDLCSQCNARCYGHNLFRNILTLRGKITFGLPIWLVFFLGALAGAAIKKYLQQP